MRLACERSGSGGSGGDGGGGSGGDGGGGGGDDGGGARGLCSSDRGLSPAPGAADLPLPLPRPPTPAPSPRKSRNLFRRATSLSRILAAFARKISHRRDAHLFGAPCLRTQITGATGATGVAYAPHLAVERGAGGTEERDTRFVVGPLRLEPLRCLYSMMIILTIHSLSELTAKCTRSIIREYKEFSSSPRAIRAIPAARMR